MLLNTAFSASKRKTLRRRTTYDRYRGPAIGWPATQRGDMGDEHYADRPAQSSGTATQSGGGLRDRRDRQDDSQTSWSAPQQRTGDEHPPPVGQHALFQHADLRDHPPILIASRFRDLRTRLFGSTSLSDYPVAVDDLVDGHQTEIDNSSLHDAQLTVDLNTPTTAPEVETPRSETTSAATLDAAPNRVRQAAVGPERPADSEGHASTVEIADEPETSPATPIGPIDWTKVSSNYAPRTERSDSRSRLTALIALAVVIAGVGVWLLFGPNAPRKLPSPRPPAPSADSADSAILGPVGIRSTVDIAHGKTVIVAQEVVFDDPVSTVTLAVPDDWSDSATTEAFDPRVTQLEVTVNGATVDIPDDPLESGDSITVSLPEPSRALTIEYAASGAVIVSEPSKEGRGLALTNVVSVSPSHGLTTTIDVNGRRILNLGCLEPGGEMFPCGWSDVDDVWEYSDVLGGSDVDVLAQVDLPN